MEIIPFASKEAYLAASIHDLVHIPYSPARSMPHILYTTCLGSLLHMAYHIEKNNLWDDLFAMLVGTASASNKKVGLIFNELKAINVYKWDEVKAILSDISKRINILYQKKENRIIDYIKRIFGFKQFFTKLYVIYGFNPMPSTSFGSMLYSDNEKVIIAVYINDIHRENHVLDLIIHELLHGLIRLNNIELEPDVEELIIDISAPDGYLSKIIGLVNKVNTRPEKVFYFQQRAEQYKHLFDLLVEYYEKKIYDKIDVIEWVKMNMK